MRLRVAVRWAGDTIEDRLHERAEVRVGAGPSDDVTVAGDERAPIRFVELRALTVVELPAALVESVEWTDGSTVQIVQDARVTLGGSRRAGRISLRSTAAAEPPTSVYFELGQDGVTRRRDVALVAWAGGALALATYLGVTLVAVQSGMSRGLAAPRELRSGEASELLRVRLNVDQTRPLVDDGETIGRGGHGRGGESQRKRPGATVASDYAKLLVRGFDRYVHGDLDAAQGAWSEASFLDPERTEAWINLAQIAKRRGDIRGEQRLLRVALDHDPDRCEALVSMALVEGRLGETRKAELAIAQARARCGAEQGFVLFNEAAVLASSGRVDDAFRSLTSAIAQLPSDDKREEALADLQQEPLFAQLRTDARYTAALRSLRDTPEHPMFQ
jgi:tetratricopeptide (TPR) repeat protein